MQPIPEASDSCAAIPEISDADRKLYEDLVAEIHKRELSSSENFDKSVLTFSSAGLALSIGFLKDFVPIQSAIASWSLYTSWALFTAATCFTMASFLVSSLALADQKVLANKYYYGRDESAFTRPNKWNRWTRDLNYGAGGSFVAALVLTTAFISINLERGSQVKPTSSTQSTHDGALVPTMQASQSTPLHRGLLVPTMQQRPTAPTTPSGSATPAPASQSPIVK